MTVDLHLEGPNELHNIKLDQPAEPYSECLFSLTMLFIISMFYFSTIVYTKMHWNVENIYGSV